MRTIFHRGIIAFCGILALSIPLFSAQAGELFPPHGITPSQNCPAGTMLWWNGATGSVECGALNLVNDCGKGEVMKGLTTNSQGQAIPVCESLGTNTCAAGQTVTSNGVGGFNCGNTCAAGQALVSDGNGGMNCAPLTFTVGADCGGSLCDNYQWDADAVCKVDHGFTKAVSFSGGFDGGSYADWCDESLGAANPSICESDVFSQGKTTGWAIRDGSCTSTCSAIHSVTCQ